MNLTEQPYAAQVVAQVDLLVELQAQMSTDPMGAIKRDAHHNTYFLKEISLDSGGHIHPEVPGKILG